MAMIYECAYGIRIAEIHSQPYAWILQHLAGVEGDVYRVAQERLIYRNAGPIDQHEVDLMDVEGVQFRGAVFDDPVFDVALLHDDVGDIGCRIEGRGSLALYRDVKSCGAIGIVGVFELLGKIEPASADGLDASEPRQRWRRKRR